MQTIHEGTFTCTGPVPVRHPGAAAMATAPAGGVRGRGLNGAIHPSREASGTGDMTWLNCDDRSGQQHCTNITLLRLFPQSLYH
jgi:hypothetical protein